MNFKIITIAEVPVLDLVNLASPVLGIGYLDKAYFMNALSAITYDGWAVCTEDNLLIGFLIVYRTTAAEVLQQVKNDTIISNLDQHICCIDTVVIAAEYRKKGIGSLLMKKAIQTYKQNHGFLLYAWKLNEKINIQRLAEAFQFKVISKPEQLWKTDCENSIFLCPAKEIDHACSCTAVLYYLKQTK